MVVGVAELVVVLAVRARPVPSPISMLVEIMTMGMSIEMLIYMMEGNRAAMVENYASLRRVLPRKRVFPPVVIVVAVSAAVLVEAAVVEAAAVVR